MLCCGFVLLMLAAAAGWWRRVTGRRAPAAAVAAVAFGQRCHPGSPSGPNLRRLPVVAALAVYTMDMGLLIFNQMEVQHAAQAGVQYVIANDYDSTGVTNAVRNATRFTAINVTNPYANPYCGCATTAPAVTYCAASCDLCNTCTGSAQGKYVSFTASPTTAYRPAFPIAVFPNNTINISSTVTVRIK